ncbi:MAG TPA: hypothetical protein VHJ20_02645 [Polyangia bacterium]|nr:hypothetical protein [Polyangia bacterium]
MGMREVTVTGLTALVVALAGCGGSGLEEPTTSTPPPAAVSIPADVVAPTLACPGAGSISIELPCQIGQAPVSEVDCELGGAAGGAKIAFVLPSSLPDGASPRLGAPTSFHPALLPFGRQQLFDGRYYLSDISGTVAFTSLSLAEQKVDGWFPHLAFTLVGTDGAIVSCTLDEGRFTAVPGDYL